jgi:hypothetical protein
MTGQIAASLGAVVLVIVIALLILQLNGVRIWPPKD